MRNYKVYFATCVTVSANDRREAEEKASLKICHLTPNDMLSEQPRVTISVRGGVAEVSKCSDGVEVRIVDYDQ